MIGIGMPTVGQTELAIRTLSSIESKHEIKPYVIVQGGHQNSHLEIEKFLDSKFDKFTTLYTPGVYCLSEAWNILIRYMIDEGVDKFILINDDVVLRPDSIDNLVDDYKDMLTTGWFNLGESLNSVINADLSNEIVRDRSFTFSFFMLSKNAFDTIGSFDVNFKPLYNEDTDYEYRIYKKGFKSFASKRALFYHEPSQTLRRNPVIAKQVGSNKDRNYRYFLDKHNITDKYYRSGKWLNI